MCDQGTKYMVNAIPYLGKGPSQINVAAAKFFTKQLVQPIINFAINIHSFYLSFFKLNFHSCP